MMFPNYFYLDLSINPLKLDKVLLLKEFKINEPVLIPHIIKYMGSKKPIINYITQAIKEVNTDDHYVCDLFSGSCSVSAALRFDYNFFSNDIQEYSKVLAHTYFSDLSAYNFEELIDQIAVSAKIHVQRFFEFYSDLFFDYSMLDDMNMYQQMELKQRKFINNGVIEIDYHLFTKYYSGTYWSFEQCVWIDSLRKVAEGFKNTPIYNAILSSIMYAMSYSTQSTGHFAQYRDGNSQEAMLNIITYREKKVFELFSMKFKDLINSIEDTGKSLFTSTLDFEDCVKTLPFGTIVYADPPYAPVHYSRFYHALETLIKYDYPKVDFKGRYRNDRHQSPFSQKGKAVEAFKNLFRGIISRKCEMVLSYSNNGVVDINELIVIASQEFNQTKYKIEIRKLDYKHSTMGRFEDADRDVIEYLIIAKFK